MFLKLLNTFSGFKIFPGLSFSRYASVICTAALGLFVAYSGFISTVYAAEKTLVPQHTTTPSSPVAAPESLLEGERWRNLKNQLFSDRPVSTAGGIVQLEAPGRAFDGARVPITARALLDQTNERYIRKLYLIVDNNPLPVAGTFTFEPNRGWDTIDTELRINEYSFVRVVAELSDSSLHMDESFVKAVGGCSAPPSSYDRSDASLLGKFTGSVDQVLNPEVPALARIRLVHPNASGMQFDQFTRTYIQPHYIHTMGAELDGKPLFTLATNFSLSQDPVLGFNFKPREKGSLLIYALDSKNQRFEQTWPVQPADL